jgi:serine/threonine kinase PknH
MSDDTVPKTDTRFGPYLLKRMLGSGGMGTVYEAEDTVMDRVVALKLISGPYAQNPDYRQRLQREARIAGRLKDPHVVPIHSTGEIDGHLYVDMRLIDGTDLDTILRQSGPLSPAKAVTMVRQIASALDAAHAVGVLHRDVKPGNILITAEDFAYLVDFGIANAATEQKLTQMGDVLGTWTYMAPERFQGDETQVTARADTYALACVLFEALTGAPPFSGDTASLIGAHLTEPVPRASSRLGLPAALDDVISRGMAKHPADRYATSGEFARAAEAALATLGDRTASIALPTAFAPPAASQPPQHTPQPPQQTPPPAQQWGVSPSPYGGPPGPVPKKRRPWVLIAAAVVVVVALAAALGIWQLTSNKSSKQAVDLSKLDVGKYNTKPRTLPGPATLEEGKFLAAYRIAEGVPDPHEVDPILDHIYGVPITDPKTAATQIAGTSTPLTQPVLEKYGMVTAYVVQGFSKRLADFVRDKSGDLLLVMLTSFPNDDAAAHAAAEMDSVDFAVNPENRGVTIPGHPTSKAHIRPGSPSIGSTAAMGTFVASIIARSDANPDVSYLSQRVKTALDQMAPLVSKLFPVVEAGLTGLPLDPDHMLSRLFVSGDVPKVGANFGSTGPRAAAFCEDSEARREGLYAQAGVDRCAVTDEGQLIRTKDDTAAKTYLPKIADSVRSEFVDHDIAPPVGLPEARCFENKQAIWADNANGRFGCFVSFGRYIGSVFSNEEKDVRQRAAAQYAILVNSA